jgi:hypothetical protein
MDCPFVPFHIRADIVKHVELQNVTWTLMDQSQAQKPRILVVQYRPRGMELGNQLGLQSWKILPFVHIMSKKPKVYSHPYSAP